MGKAIILSVFLLIKMNKTAYYCGLVQKRGEIIYENRSGLSAFPEKAIGVNTDDYLL